MGGLAIGAAVAGRVAVRLSPQAALRAYAALELLIAALAFALPFELSWLEPLLAWAYGTGSGGATFALVRIACALAVVTLPAVAMGATLPLVVRGSVTLAARAGREAGLLYAMNTLGAAAGAILAGFVLLPALGMRATTFVAMALNGGSAALGWWVAGQAGATGPETQAAPRKPAAHCDRGLTPRPRHAPGPRHEPEPRGWLPLRSRSPAPSRWCSRSRGRAFLRWWSGRRPLRSARWWGRFSPGSRLGRLSEAGSRAVARRRGRSGSRCWCLPVARSWRSRGRPAR